MPLSYHKVPCLKQSASTDQLRLDNLLRTASLSTKNKRACERAALLVSLAHRPLPLAEERQAYPINNSILSLTILKARILLNPLSTSSTFSLYISFSVKDIL